MSKLGRIDAKIAKNHDLELRAYWACKDEQAQWYVFQVMRLQGERWAVEQRKARHRERHVMLWTILIVLAIIALIVFIASRIHR